MKLRNIILKVSAPIYNMNYRKKNKQTEITFVSQNCIGGVLYHMLGLEFKSPTINMFIEDENFVKLAENPRHYFQIDAEPFEERHIDANDNALCYPVIKVDDILLCCQHFSNCEEAVLAWNKRRIRVNFDNIYVIASSWNLHERKDLVERINNLPWPSVIFTTEDFGYSKCIKLAGDKWYKETSGVVHPALTSFDGLSGRRHFCREFDFVEWINCGLNENL